jgi:hypothetical protein
VLPGGLEPPPPASEAGILSSRPWEQIAFRAADGQADGMTMHVCRERAQEDSNPHLRIRNPVSCPLDHGHLAMGTWYPLDVLTVRPPASQAGALPLS